MTGWRRRLLLAGPTTALALIGLLGTAAGFTEKEEREIYATLDPEGIGTVNREQFEATKMNAFFFRRHPSREGRMEPLSFEQSRLSRQFFDRVDTNHDGMIEGIEMNDAVHFEDIDARRRGYFDFADLTAYLNKIGR
jgi:hypothetical protein